MFIEMQISAARFTELLRERIAQNLPCISFEFDWPPSPDPKSSLSVIDHIEVGTGTLHVARGGSTNIIQTRHGEIEFVLGPTMRIWQPLFINIANLADVEIAKPGPVPPEKLTKVIVLVFMDVRAYNRLPSGGLGSTDAGGPTLSVYISDVLIPDGPLKNIVKAELIKYSFSVPINMNAINNLFTSGYPPEIANMGISDDGGEKLLAIRIEFSYPDYEALANWTKFFQVGTENVLGSSRDWAIVVDGGFFVRKVDAEVVNGIENDGRMIVKYYPSGTLNPGYDDNSAKLEIKLGGEVSPDRSRTACTIATDITIHGELRVVSGDLQLWTKSDYDLDDFDVVKCGVEIGLLGSLTGAIVG